MIELIQILISLLNWFAGLFGGITQSVSVLVSSLNSSISSVFSLMPVHPLIPYDVLFTCLAIVVGLWTVVVLYNLIRAAVSFFIPGGGSD